MSDEFSSKIVLTSSGGEQAEIQNLPAPVMQALYHQITGKREKTVQRYDDDFIVDKKSIDQLIIKLAQTLEQFQSKAQNVSIDVFHHGRDRITHSSPAKFNHYDTSKPDPVSSVVIDASFLISAPTFGQFQSYEIQIDINSYNIMKDDKHAAYSGRGREYKEHSIEVSISYVDYVIARSFKSTIDEWVNTLEKQKLWRLPKIVVDYDFRFSNYISIPTATSVAVIVNYAFPFMNTTSGAIVLLGLSLLIWRVTADICEFGLSIVGSYGSFPVIILNRGDERNHKIFLERREKAKKLGWFILASCSLPIVLGVVSSFIFENFLR
ncbi:hypothetical protein [Devosia sp. FKR38]|uniref:hypothetical protein n=1 Tax=Devosia sp. FKR38 TaxID=2562312 RepID=UPI0010C04AB0|nr:hypothetical protein [Devosia sp. FKR38]